MLQPLCMRNAIVGHPLMYLLIDCGGRNNVGGTKLGTGERRRMWRTFTSGWVLSCDMTVVVSWS